MREITGEVALAVSVFVDTITKVIIAIEANMLAFHALVSAFKHFIAFVTPEVAVLVDAIGYLLITCGTDMIIYFFVIAVYDSVAIVTVIIAVLVNSDTNEYSITFVFIAVSVIVIVTAIVRHPHIAVIARVIVIGIVVIIFVRILFALCFLAANITKRIVIRIDVRPA